MLEIGMTSAFWCREDDYEWSMDYIRGCGFDSIDYNVTGFLTPTMIESGQKSAFFDQSIEELLDYYRKLEEAAAGSGVKISQIHAPFPIWVAGMDEMNEYLITVLEKCCAICAFLQCPALVIHPYLDPDRERQEQINRMLCRRIAPYARKYGVKICIENIPVYSQEMGRFVEGAFTDPEEICRCIDALNQEAGEELFGFCLDIGHMNLLGNEPRAFIERLDSRLKVLHIHDNWGATDDHTIPYMPNRVAQVDWDGFLEGLRSIGFEGALSFEVSVAELPEQIRTDSLKMISSIGRHFREQLSKD